MLDAETLGTCCYPAPMHRLFFARFVAPAAVLLACSATAPLPEDPPSGGGGNGGASGSAAAGKNGGRGGNDGAGAGGTSSAGTTSGGVGGGAGVGDPGTGGKKPSAGAGGKGGIAGAAGKSGASAGQPSAGDGGTSAGDAGSQSGGAAGSGDPFGGGGNENGGTGGADSCDLEKVAPGDGLSCTSINYITTGDPCLGCDRGPSLYFCADASTPPSPGCTTLPSSGPGYFCCDKSVCTPQPGGCDDQVRYHCPPDATVPAACKKLGGDPTSYCCPQ